MKTIKHLLTCLLLSSAVVVQAQSSAPALESAPPALNQLPPAQEKAAVAAAPAENPAPVLFSRKPQFSMAMGSQFSRFGQAAYLQPTVALPLTPRFQAFASVQFINSFGPAFYRNGAEAGTGSNSVRSQQSFVVMAGGQYALTEKLHLTGSLWRDLGKFNGLDPYRNNGFSPAGSQGMTLRAHYKVTDNLSISGGFRYGNGPAYQGYNRHLYQDFYSPFGL